MKIMSVLGTRPEIIRLSEIIARLDCFCNHILVHTGQNYDIRLNDIFFEQMGIRSPDHYLGAQGSLGEQISMILSKIETILLEEKPEKFLVLGDTNSALSVIIAKRLGVPVYHLEAGNRCYDDRVPEEINRRIIDHSSDILLPYTERSRQNLLREGIRAERIFVVNNPIFEVIRKHEANISQSKILSHLGLHPGEYFLVSLHRAENISYESRLSQLILGLDQIQKHYKLPVIISTHPSTKNRMENIPNTPANKDLRFLEPFGFFDFITLEKNARCVITDSGTVQEECCIFRVPNVTIRDTTERPETLEYGSNILSGADPHQLALCVNIVLEQDHQWNIPPEYLAENVSDIVIKILLGYRTP